MTYDAHMQRASRLMWLSYAVMIVDVFNDTDVWLSVSTLAFVGFFVSMLLAGRAIGDIEVPRARQVRR